MEKVRNFRQLYFCCGCSLKIGCYFVAGLEMIHPILSVCSPLTQETHVIVLTWFIYVSSSVLLLFGTFRDSSLFLCIWIIARLIIFVLGIVGMFILIKELHEKYVDSMKLIVFYAMSGIIFFGISGYFWTIVYSHYMELKEKKRREIINTPPAV